MSVNGNSNFRRPYEPLLPGCFHIDSPWLYRNAYVKGDGPQDEAELGRIVAAQLEREIVFQGPDTVAAFIAEPIQGAGGVIVPPANFWPLVREVCNRHGVLLIADEVVTGFGRGGAMFGTRLWDVQADLWCLAKGISSGYIPLGATAISAKVADVFDSDSTGAGQISHGYTYSAHPVAAAAAIATLKILQADDVPGHVARGGTGLPAAAARPGAARALRRQRARQGPDAGHRDGRRQGRPHTLAEDQRHPGARGESGLPARPDGARVGREHDPVAAAGHQRGRTRPAVQHARSRLRRGRGRRMNTVLLVGTADTKRDELAFLRERIEALGARVLLMDVGVLAAGNARVDIANSQVAEAAGNTLQAVIDSGDENSAMTLMAQGASAIASRLHADGRIHGMLALGGSMGTDLAFDVAAALPLGLPKVVVSTIANSHLIPPERITPDLIMVLWAGGLYGLNSLCKSALAQGAGAVVGAMQAALPPRHDRPLVGMTSLGKSCLRYMVTLKPALEARGYEVAVFHSSGMGGRAFEALAAAGHFCAVMDFSLQELANHLGGSVVSAGADRLSGAGRSRHAADRGAGCRGHGRLSGVATGAVLARRPGGACAQPAHRLGNFGTTAAPRHRGGDRRAAGGRQGPNLPAAAAARRRGLGPPRRAAARRRRARRLRRGDACRGGAAHTLHRARCAHQRRRLLRRRVERLRRLGGAGPGAGGPQLMRALVLDFGGVISRTLFETHDDSERALGLAPGTLTWRGPFDRAETDALWRDMQAGRVSERDYWMARTREVGQRLGEDWREMQTLVQRTRGAEPDAVARPQTLATDARRARSRPPPGDPVERAGPVLRRRTSPAHARAARRGGHRRRHLHRHPQA